MTTFKTFSRVGAEKYSRIMRRKGALWFFHHIPKTAGSSLTRELSFCFAPYYNIHLEGWGEGVDRAQGLMDAVDVFLEEHKTTHFRSCSGHLRLPHVRKLTSSLPELRAFTFLRDPVERFVSEYRYSCTEKHPPSATFVKQFPTIDAYLEWPGSRDKMWNFVASPALEGTQENIDAIFNRYAFIGTVETLARDFAYMSAFSGYPKAPGTRANTTVGSSKNKVDLTPELRDKIEKANAKDVAFYEAVTSSLTAQNDEMVAFCDSQRELYEPARSA